MTTLLIIDDSRVARMLLRAFVLERRPEMVVLEAANADEALARAAETPDIDLVSIDYSMPGVDGLQLAEQLQPLLPGARKVLMTANIQESIRSRAGALGIDFVAKPITEVSVDAMLALLDVK
ncbi:MAG: response regulator [Rhodocyclaceae bacterium]|nr:response regulator [Rhodocyclaceae bacterium]